MATETIVRPDAKGRVGLGLFLRRLAGRLGMSPSGFSAEMQDDGTIVLRPRVEVSADRAGTLLLADADRDRLLAALDDPAPPNEVLRAARDRHADEVEGG